MKQYRRSERFNKLLLEELSDIVQHGLKDPRIGFVSFTRVETTEDLRSAKIHVSLLDEAQAPDTLEALRHAAGMIRGELMHRIQARRIPELRFVHDRSIAHSVHIAEVLDQLKRERDGGAPGGGEGEGGPGDTEGGA
ncbi:MAG TPA: 30S ribosome-binding factor RbfA [bacterium]